MNAPCRHLPQRIVCRTAGTVEVLHALGEQGLPLATGPVAIREGLPVQAALFRNRAEEAGR